MTIRCRWLIAVSIMGMVLGFLAESRGYHFAILNLMFLIWVAMEWFLFRLKTINSSKFFLSLVRTVDGSAADSVSIALNQEYEVRLDVAMRDRTTGLRMFLSDLMPAGLESNDRFPAVVDIGHQRSLRWSYRITPKVTGKVALPGLQVTFTDKFGFFRIQKFQPLRQELTLLPFIIQASGTSQIVKTDNMQLLAGHHRHKRPGISSELLGIREYRKGDPPRSIAWKATARTGQLMTCEYESEVPVRCTLIADVSGYQFWGRPYAAPFDSIASAVASITQLLIEDKDPVGVVLVNGENKARVRPNLGKRQFVRILQCLMAAHPGDHSVAEFDVEQLVEFIWRAVYRLYPELLSPTVNRPRTPLLLFGPSRRYRYFIRHQVAAVLNWLQGGTALRGYELVHDDSKFREACSEFLNRHPSISNSMAVTSDFGRSKLDKETAISSMATSLIEGVARARDNELFVLIGDFGVAPHVFEKLENSIRVARANYHRVMLLNIPLNDVSRYIQNGTARQAYEYLQKSNLHSEVRHFVGLQQLGATISLLSDVKMLENVVSELRILKSGGSRGPSNPSLMVV